MSDVVTQEKASYWVARQQRRLVWMMDLCCIGCVGASLLVLMLSGEFPLALLWLDVAALFLSIFFGRTDFVTRHRRWFNLLLVVSLVFFVFRAFAYERYLYEAMLFLATVEVVKLFQRSEPTDILQIMSMALVSMIVGAIANPDLVFAFSFLVMLILMTWCLLLLHFYRDACTQVDGAISIGVHPKTVLPGLKRHLSMRFITATTAMSFVLFFCTALVFLLFPRMGLGFLFRGVGGGNVTGFADNVTLGQHGKINVDSTVIARVEIPGSAGGPPPMMLYLRGRSLSLYESGRWRKNYVKRLVANGAHRSMVTLPVTGAGVPLEKVAQSARIYLEPLSSKTPVVPVPMGSIRIDFSPSSDVTGVGKRVVISQDSDGDILHTARSRFRLIYDVEYRDGPSIKTDAPRAQDQRYLFVPKELEGPLGELGSAWREGREGTNKIAARIEANLKRQYRYTLDSPKVESGDPVTSFLFKTKRGHCEYFATAMALILRTQGIPTRVVNGFAGGEWNRPGGFFTIRNRHAHSWVEVYSEQGGWVRFDPTPRVFDTEPSGFWANVQRYLQNMKLKWLLWVVSYNADRQMEVFYAARARWNQTKDDFDTLSTSMKWIVLTAVLSLFAFLLWWWRRRRRAGRGEIVDGPERLPALNRLESKLARAYRPRHLAEPTITYLLRAAQHFEGLDDVDPGVAHALRKITGPLAEQLYNPAADLKNRRAVSRSLRKLRRQIPFAWKSRAGEGTERAPEPPSIRGKQAA